MKGLKKILFCILSILNRIVLLLPINPNRITFVSLESNQLESDLKQIYNQLDKSYDIKMVLISYKKNSLWNNFLYMLNTFLQIYYINTSKIVLISDNNYVISNFKRRGVTVIQVWHATGAVKKFGNCLEREYVIKNYDYVLACSPYWSIPYSEAFGVDSQDVKIIGLPRIDYLFQDDFKKESISSLEEKYPQIIGKKIILYTPTFRGNIYKGFEKCDFDFESVMKKLGDDYILVYKHHPLIKNNQCYSNNQIIDGSQEDLYQLFMITDIFISDYSSVIFDYSLLQKKMIFYVPDLEEYQQSVGHFVDYQEMPGAICKEEKELIEAIKSTTTHDTDSFSSKYFTYHDNQNTTRINEWINDLMKRT